MRHNFYKIFRDYKEISLRYDPGHRAVWCYYNPTARPCFSLTMLEELLQMQKEFMECFNTRKADANSLFRYFVLHSQIPEVFNLGGDLALFSTLIREKKRSLLRDYARQCVKICYLNAVNLHLPLTTISLVEGVALGGGFESALSSNVLIATENAEMGFPEIRFNLFPGMGAYSLLARRCGMVTADKIIESGITYNAKLLYKMGVVNDLAETGNGLAHVEKFMRRHQQTGNGHRALQQVRQRYHPIDHQELIDITEIWVDAALRLDEKDLRLIDRLVRAQSKKISSQRKRGQYPLRTSQDRRFLADNISFPLSDWAGKTVLFDRRNHPERRIFN